MNILSFEEAQKQKLIEDVSDFIDMLDLIDLDGDDDERLNNQLNQKACEIQDLSHRLGHRINVDFGTIHWLHAAPKDKVLASIRDMLG